MARKRSNYLSLSVSLPPSLPPSLRPPSSLLPINATTKSRHSLKKYTKVNLFGDAALREYLHNANCSECRFTLQKLTYMINMCSCFAIPSEKNFNPQFSITYLRKKCEPMNQMHRLTTIRKHRHLLFSLVN